MANLDNNAIECKTIKDLLERYQLVIPEIQREYVWGDPCIGKDVLGAFYEDLLDGFEQYQSFDARVAESVSKRKSALADAGVDLEDAQIQDVVRRDLEKAGLPPPYVQCRLFVCVSARMGKCRRWSGSPGKLD